MGQVPQFRSAGLIRAQIIILWLHGSAEIFLHISMENSSSAHSQYTTTIQNILCGCSSALLQAAVLSSFQVECPTLWYSVDGGIADAFLAYDVFNIK